MDQCKAIELDTDFPGGNILVEGVDGKEITVRPDPRDTEEYWFYWYFRARGCAGETLTVRFTAEPVFTAQGPAVSTDGGSTWRWLGRGVCSGSSFAFEVPPDINEVRFAVAPPYTQSNLDEFLARRGGDPHLERAVLCLTPAGHDAELLRAGRLDGQAPIAAALTCRHHACEMMANYELEGILDAVLADTEDGAWFRENVEFLVVPFVDKDGVEAGDQGKFRLPHDHARDYGPTPRYATVRAIEELLPRRSAGRLQLAMDLHCPWIGGGWNDEIFFVEGPYAACNRAIHRTGDILERVQHGPLRYERKNDIPFGFDWNKRDPSDQSSFARWVRSLSDRPAAMTLEFPYSQAGGRAVTPENARAFGADLASAIRVFLDQPEEGGAREDGAGSGELVFTPPLTADHLDIARSLLLEYARELQGLGVSLCFQDFEEEVGSLPGKYAMPEGNLLLALDGSDALGCVAVRRHRGGTCEMKRLYIRPEHRGHGLGRWLAEAIVASARQLGYRRMVLDTVGSMKAAVTLYESMGFRRIPAYYHNPLPDVVYMELALQLAC